MAGRVGQVTWSVPSPDKQRKRENDVLLLCSYCDSYAEFNENHIDGFYFV